MKLSNAQIEAVAQEIINVKTAEINELYEKTVEKAVKKEYDEYLKSDFAMKIGMITVINPNVYIGVDIKNKKFNEEYSYNSTLKVGKVDKSIYDGICSTYKNSLLKDLNISKVRHLITLNTIDAKDLQELIKIVTSKL